MSLLNTITDSNQIMSVIEDTGDHVLKLAFVETEAPVDQRYSLQKRYLLVTVLSMIVFFFHIFFVHLYNLIVNLIYFFTAFVV